MVKLLYSEIDTILEKKLLVYHDLLGTLEDEKEFIVHKNVAEIWKNNKRKKDLIKKLEFTKKDLKALLVSYGLIPASKKDTIELAEITNLIGLTGLMGEPEIYSSISRNIGKIVSVKRSLADKSKLNSGILRESLQVFDEIVSTVFKPPGSQTSYDNNGRSQKDSRNNLSYSREV